jgi:LmbE family N-acetylglucosaminyl deacetylase
MSKVSRFVTVLFIFLCVSASLRLEASAQVRPVYDRGAVGLQQILKRLNTTASVLMIGAHPDDEDTALLTYLARGESARTAYLSLTRGDGGQNIIGTELGESLGVIRTEELLQARRLDGAEQYFTRAYDYGFSKTLAEAKGKWDEKVILCDAVRVIRNFRPLVVVSQFSGTPADGHGQHQFAGYISPLAVKAAADATQCKDAGEVWQVKKFYVRHRGTGEPTLRINTGKYDPLLGRSYFEIAMEARSQHKSQEQGVLELKGDQFSGLNLVGGGPKETSIFEGIERSLTTDLQTAIDAAIKEFDLRSPEKSITALARAYELAYRGLRRTNLSPAAKDEFSFVSGQLSEAIITASGIQIDALADREIVVPGETISVSAKAFLPDGIPVKVSKLELSVPERWRATPTDPPTTNSPAFVMREAADLAAFYNVTVPSDWKATQPYWLDQPREGDLFRWDNEERYKTAPLQRRQMLLIAMFQIDHQWLSVIRPIEYRYADDIRGEIRRNVDVVPKVTVEMDQSLMIVPYSDKPQTKQVVMTVTNHSRQAVTGSVSLNFNSPTEWKYTNSSATFELKRTGEKTAITFDVTIPAKTKLGSYQIYGQAMIGEALANITMKTIAYPHIQTHRYYRRATVDAKVVDLKMSPVKIGYITGSGDRVQDAIRQMGFSVETISESALASGNLSKYDTIVVGIRAFQVRPDVVANNQRLLEYARGGGTLVVQYQLPAYAPLAPFTTQMGPRVVDENAAVNLVDPKHPIFNFPNKITQDDFAGWVQERNLYNFTNFGAEYTGLLESHDAGEAENKGGLVLAKIGKGNYVYCSYSMFRQLPAGVPGAYRLFANLVSLPKVGKK